jgi:hypothetical protein
VERADAVKQSWIERRPRKETKKGDQERRPRKETKKGDQERRGVWNVFAVTAVIFSILPTICKVEYYPFPIDISVGRGVEVQRVDDKIQTCRFFLTAVFT